MKKYTRTTITLIALTALAACATPAAGKVVSVKKYLETHSREELRAVVEAKRGKTSRTSSSRLRGDDMSDTNGPRGRSLSAYDYCEVHHDGTSDPNQHCAGTIQDRWGRDAAQESCEFGPSRQDANGDFYSPGVCMREFTHSWDSSLCGNGMFIGLRDGYDGVCTPCSLYSDTWYGGGRGACKQCTSDSDCPNNANTTDPTYCAQSSFFPSKGYCSSCKDCYEYNVFNGNSCPSQCTNYFTAYATGKNFKASSIRDDAEQFSLGRLPGECWHDAAMEDFDELYVGDCGAFGEETELWCEGFCLADSWLDCCDPKAGAIAALTMGCFFAAVGALFSAAWIFKCWCFKKPNALMLQAMANQQQQRAMAAGQMQSPVVVQMQAAAPARK